jgi:integrase
MSILTKERTKESFFEVKLSECSEGTKRQYDTGLKDFELFCKRKHNRTLEQMIPELKISATEDIIEFFQEWINASTNNPHTKRSRAGYVDTYLFYRGVKIDPREMKDLKFGKNIQELKEPLSRELIKQIISKASPRRRVLYMVLISTGARGNEAVMLRKKDFDTTQERVKVTIFQKKSGIYRIGYLTSEAYKYVKPVLDKLKDNDLVFASNEDPEKAIVTESQCFRRLIDGLGYKGNRYHSRTRHYTLHSFRSFTFTQFLKTHNEGIAHGYLGRKRYLDSYLRLDDEDKIKQFLKVEPELFIFEAKPESERIKDLEEKQKDLENTVEVLRNIILRSKEAPIVENEEEDWHLRKVM